MKRYQKFFILWLANSSLLYFAANFFPANFTLGNSFMTTFQSAAIAGLIWNLALWYAGPFFEDLEFDMKNPTSMMLLYLSANFAVVWLLARFAVLTGLGISSWVYVLFLAIAANFLQYFLWQKMEKK